MDSNIIKFRLSPELLELLESVKHSDESLHQTARRILESSLKGSTQPGHTEPETVHKQQEDGTQAGHTEPETVHNKPDNGTQLGHKNTDSINEIVQQKLEAIESDLYSRLSDQLNGLLETRLGELLA
jgi:hypothetical protein